MRTAILTGILTLFTVAIATQPEGNNYDSKPLPAIHPTTWSPDDKSIQESIHRIEETQKKTDELIIEQALEMKPE